LLSYTKLAGMSLEQITQDIAESVVFRRPVIELAKKTPKENVGQK
jgi:hypothetical protein